MTSSGEEMTMGGGESDDLPLMSNTGDIQVYHYILDLRCDLTEHIMTGSITLFLKPCVKSSNGSRRIFSMQDHHHAGKEKSQVDEAGVSSESMHTSLVQVGTDGKTQLSEHKTDSGLGSTDVDGIHWHSSSTCQSAHIICNSKHQLDCHREVRSQQQGASNADNSQLTVIDCDVSTSSASPGASSCTSCSDGGSVLSSQMPSHSQFQDCPLSSRLQHNIATPSKKCSSDIISPDSVTSSCIRDSCSASVLSHMPFDHEQVHELTSTDISIIPISGPSTDQASSSSSHLTHSPSNMASLNSNSHIANLQQNINTHKKSETNLTCLLANCINEKSAAINKEVNDESGYNYMNSLMTGVDSEDNFKFILDCVDLEVNEVEELIIPRELGQELDRCCHDDLRETHDLFERCRRQSCKPLAFQVDKWCIRMTKAGVKSPEDFPHVVKILYKTKPNGSSLRWTLDQDERACMYTSAMFINNRAFFPGQEFGSLSTWQAYIRSPEGATVIMSGDSEGQIIANSNISVSDGVTWYHKCRMPLPVFTLAIAVGYWDSVMMTPRLEEFQESGQGDMRPDVTCHHLNPPCRINFTPVGPIPCRLFAPRSLLPKIESELRKYWPRASKAVQEMLGCHPFWRVDVVIYPSCNQDMAMANPNLMFLSQSVFAGDGSLMVKVAHELTHSWFGLLIGAKDWTEEWLSEGFATYLEDSVHALAMQWSEEEGRERAELRALIRQHTLQAEMGTTQDSVQILRPNQDECQDEDNVTSVKNGMNAYKMFTQVHYLKGYFLLRHLSSIVGVHRFNAMLKKFIIKYHGSFVLSQDFLNLCFTTFPELSESGMSLESVYSDWLDCPGMPKGMECDNISAENRLYRDIIGEVNKWKSFNKVAQRKSLKRKRKQFDVTESVELNADQMVLLLEELFSLDTLSSSTLSNLRKVYRLDTCNADVRHRWCELVVKHRYSPAYEDVRIFLIHDQAMGVYLYGELMISGCRKQQELARRCFTLVSPQMEPTTRNIVKKMLYAS